MKFAKKILLGSIVAITMAIAFMVGIMGLNTKASSNVGKVIDSTVSGGGTNINPIPDKPTSYTYDMQDVSIQKGADTLSYSYNPHTSQKGGTPAVAYEYIFGNPNDRTSAVNLKELDTTDVNVSYAWGYEPITSFTSITTYTNYTCQTIDTSGQYLYIYVFVSPISTTIPATFTSSVVWYYGFPKQQQIVNNVTGEITTQTIVTGQSIDKNTLTTPQSFVKDEDGTEVTYYFDAWFLDKEYTQLVYEDEVKPGQKVYARYHNIDPSKTDCWEYTEDGYIFSPDDYGRKSGAGYSQFGNLKTVVMPALYNDGVNGEDKVITIGYRAFCNNDSGYGSDVVNLSLPCTLKTIDDDAFRYCESLTSVDLSGCTSLTSIGYSVFEYCSELTSIDLSNCTSLTGIEDYAFSCCSGLTSITLPSSVTSIGAEAFFDCTSLIEIYNLSSLNIVAGTSYINSNGEDTYLGEYAKKIHNDLKSPRILQQINNVHYLVYDNNFIAYKLFDNSITSIVLDKRITEIADNLFSECENLISIDLSGCVKLTNIEGAFSECKNLISIDLSGCVSLTSIGNYAFEGYNSLGTVNLRGCDGLTSIGEEAFQDSPNLTSIVIPKNVTKIGENAFRSCGIIEVYNLSKLNIVPGTEYGNTDLRATVVHSSLSEPSIIEIINNMVYVNYNGKFTTYAMLDKSITSITSLDNRTTNIGSGTFDYCDNLSIVDLSGCNNLTTIGNGAFEYCHNLTSIKLPSSLTSIGNEAFSGCSKLTSIVIPSSLTSIGNNAFEGCESLTSIVIPASVTSIGSSAFSYCSRLTSITLPSSLTSIGNNAFECCESLTSIVIPASVTKIGSYAFQDCYELTNITFEVSGTWYYGTKAQQEAMSGGTKFEIVAGTDYSEAFTDTYYSKYWYKK